MPPEPVEVGQRARVIAADTEAASAWVWDHVTEEGDLKGEWITDLIEAFARHRLAALSAGMKE